MLLALMTTHRVVAGSVRLSCVSGRKHSVQNSRSLLKDQVLAQVDVLRKWKETTAYKYVAHVLSKQLGEKVRDYTFLHLARLSRSALRNQQIIQVSRFEGPFRPTRTRNDAFLHSVRCPSWLETPGAFDNNDVAR